MSNNIVLNPFDAAQSTIATDQANGAHLYKVKIAAGAPGADGLAAYNSVVTTTRPANTTAYAAGDVVGGVISFALAGPANSNIIVSGVDLRYDVSAIPSGMSSFRLHLYTVTPPSALADNAVWDLPSGDRSAYAGFIDLGSITDLGSTLWSQVDGVNRQLKMGTAETTLYGYLVTVGAYTPAANSEVIQTTLKAITL